MSMHLGRELAQRASLSPDLEAYVEPSTDTRLSFGELNGHANRCAATLRALGLNEGDRVALLMQNSVDFVGLFYGAAKLGLVVVPLNTRLAAAEIAFILADSGARVLVHGPEFSDAVAGLPADGEHPARLGACIRTGSGGEGADSLGDLLARASADEPHVRGRGDDNLFIMYTSGTTGRPKGVVHTHATVSYSALSWATTLDVRYRDRLLLPLPMFHVAALTAVIMCVLRGVTIVSMPAFDPRSVWRLMRDEEVTLAGAVPAILNFMRQAPEFAEFSSTHLRYFITGAAPMPKALIELYNEKGMQVMQGYALTETGGGGSFLLNDDADGRAGCAGKPGMFAEIRLRDADGNLSERGTGEVVFRAPFLMKEYWNRPDATAKAFDQGWFRTGDVAEIDDDGFIWIKDRIKDMIISGGENIYPAEIENVILSHAAVREVAVIGLRDEKWGEVACAVVVADPEAVSPEGIVALCESKLSRYKLPKKVEYIDVLPRNPAGKVLKRALKERYES